MMKKVGIFQLVFPKILIQVWSRQSRQRLTSEEAAHTTWIMWVGVT
jgi:hypothetical protein